MIQAFHHDTLCAQLNSPPLLYFYKVRQSRLERWTIVCPWLLWLRPRPLDLLNRTELWTTDPVYSLGPKSIIYRCITYWSRPSLSYVALIKLFHAGWSAWLYQGTWLHLGQTHIHKYAKRFSSKLYYTLVVKLNKHSVNLFMNQKSHQS